MGNEDGSGRAAHVLDESAGRQVKPRGSVLVFSEAVLPDVPSIGGLHEDREPTALELVQQTECCAVREHFGRRDEVTTPLSGRRSFSEPEAFHHLRHELRELSGGGWIARSRSRR